MGFIEDVKNLKVFTLDHIKDKDLVIKMLKYEDSIYLGEKGKEIYENEMYRPRISLDPEYAINRMVLLNFGFDTSDESTENYRKIFSHYYKSALDYDKDVLSSVTYMRNNKCVYYTKPVLEIGDQIPNCRIYKLDGIIETSLFDELGNDFNFAFVGAFSNS
ncbi:hypothetical protein Catovirus_1_984 [Catovirus CTV1]|uniref:Uncharacterized protein n=1 Tax=Catovirus CTV1 TaxID=1977631 RepID=A0A1V0SB86_9VIRU|nr:hypothetical protein Catovirus_1_984 [Catovirus CTV1]